jgi:hypothetical protein
MKDVHSRVQPLQVVGLGLIKPLDMVLKHGENAASGIAGFEAVGERVGERIDLGTFFVRFQGIIENQSEVRRCGSGVSVRHKGEVRNRGEDSRIVDNGERDERHASKTCTAYL